MERNEKLDLLYELISIVASSTVSIETGAGSVVRIIDADVMISFLNEAITREDQLSQYRD